MTQSGKPISQIAKEMGLTESALRHWVKQAQIDQAAVPNAALTTEELKNWLGSVERSNACNWSEVSSKKQPPSAAHELRSMQPKPVL